MSLLARDDWPKNGPGISKSQTALRELSREMDLCTDEDELDALWASYGPVLKLSWEFNEAFYISLKTMYLKLKTELKIEGEQDELAHKRYW